jgi:hypothetical protein
MNDINSCRCLLAGRCAHCATYALQDGRHTCIVGRIVQTCAAVKEANGGQFTGDCGHLLASLCQRRCIVGHGRRGGRLMRSVASRTPVLKILPIASVGPHGVAGQRSATIVERSVREIGDSLYSRL